MLREVLTEQPEAVRLREELQGLPEEAGYDQRIQLGQLVMDAIAAKRAVDVPEVDRRLGPHALASMSTDRSAEGLVYASFLVEDDRRTALRAGRRGTGQALERPGQDPSARAAGPVRLRGRRETRPRGRIAMGLFTRTGHLAAGARCAASSGSPSSSSDEAHRQLLRPRGDPAARSEEVAEQRESGELTEEEAARQEDDLSDG